MELQTDPKTVAKLAKKREEANWRFRTFLKGIDLEVEELDAIAQVRSVPLFLTLWND